MAPRRVNIVPHTHWDREWYEPFQSFRMSLVDTIDSLISIMSADNGYSFFLLDGQMAAVDDYLEIRPQSEQALRKLHAAGRLALGPWYVLCDEFLVSSETIVRNLQVGMERASAFGEPMMVGYLPDMFGHVAQMPQILRRAGIEHAVVWRGVPQAIDRTAFWWTAPDGSAVRAEYLVHGYGNGAHLPISAEKLIERIRAYEAETAPFLLDGILMMNGADHVAPQPGLPGAIAEAASLQDSYEICIASLEDVLRSSPVEGLASWTGELRSGARAHLLMGVASNRVDVKQAAARAERAIEQVAEPLCALFLPPEQWPTELLSLAWRRILHNSAHDSICACSADEVVDAVLCRYAEANQIARGLSKRALDALSAQVAHLAGEEPIVVNTSARSRSGVVELVIPSDMALDGAQVITEPSVLPDELTLDTQSTRTILDSVHDTAVGDDAFVQDVKVRSADPQDSDGLGQIEVSVTLGAKRTPSGAAALAESKRELYARIGAQPDAVVHLRISHQRSLAVVAYVEDVPGFGWRGWSPHPLPNPVRVEWLDCQDRDDWPAGQPDRTGVRNSGPVMDNGVVRVVVNPEDGTFAANDCYGLGRLVNGGDCGDTYNYSPPPRDRIVDQPCSVEVEVLERGPVRAVVEVRSEYTWPREIEEGSGARTGTVTVTVTTRIELRANETLVRVATSFINHCKNHRLRAHFPLPEPARSSTAESAFAVVTRGLYAEGSESEKALATFPSRRFVSAGGLTIFHEGLLEYELVDIAAGEARTLALTLLRCTGILSQLTTAYRLLPAGPQLALDGPQLQGPVEMRYAVHVGALDTAGMYALAEDAFLPLIPAEAHEGRSPELAVQTSFPPVEPVRVADDILAANTSAPPRAGTLQAPPLGSALDVSGAEVSAVLLQDGHLIIRVFNPSDTLTTVHVPGRSGLLVDLRGNVLSDFDSSFELSAWSIATARIDPAIHPEIAHASCG